MLKITFLLLMPFLTLAEEQEAAYTFKEPVVIGEDEGAGVKKLGHSLGASSRFNYYENQSLRASSSVFVEGLGQRFLDLSFNDFSLRDPSSPTGVFNIAALSSLKNMSLNLIGGSGMEIDGSNFEGSQAYAAASSLGEVGMGLIHGLCRKSSCHSFDLSMKKEGGYSNLGQGVEKDWVDEVTFSGAKSFIKDDTVVTTRLLYYGQILDLDSVGPLQGRTLESKTAEALNSVFFIGQDFDFSAKHRLMLSYTRSYRNQSDPELLMSFRQRGEVFESTYIQGPNFRFKAFYERFNLYSSKDSDSGFSLSKKIKFKDFTADFLFGKTKVRSLNWSIETGYRNFVLFYKGLPPSLFQQSYNTEFSSSNELDSQEIVGVRFSKTFNFKNLKLQLNNSYTRTYKLVDFDLINSSYLNLGEVENLFTGVELRKGSFVAFIQNQVARQVGKVKKDLPRRAPWTFGLRFKKRIKSLFKIEGGLRWVSKRKAFDQSTLKATWISDVKLSYKNFDLSCTNVASEKSPVFKDLARKPFAVRLSFQKNF